MAVSSVLYNLLGGDPQQEVSNSPAPPVRLPPVEGAYPSTGATNTGLSSFDNTESVEDSSFADRYNNFESRFEDNHPVLSAFIRGAGQGMGGDLGERIRSREQKGEQFETARLEQRFRDQQQYEQEQGLNVQRADLQGRVEQERMYRASRYDAASQAKERVRQYILGRPDATKEEIQGLTDRLEAEHGEYLAPISTESYIAEQEAKNPSTAMVNMRKAFPKEYRSFVVTGPDGQPDASQAIQKQQLDMMQMDRRKTALSNAAVKKFEAAKDVAMEANMENPVGMTNDLNAALKMFNADMAAIDALDAPKVEGSQPTDGAATVQPPASVSQPAPLISPQMQSLVSQLPTTVQNEITADLKQEQQRVQKQQEIEHRLAKTKTVAGREKLLDEFYDRSSVRSPIGSSFSNLGVLYTTARADVQGNPRLTRAQMPSDLPYEDYLVSLNIANDASLPIVVTTQDSDRLEKLAAETGKKIEFIGARTGETRQTKAGAQ